MRLVENLDYLRVMTVADQSQAFMIGTGRAQFPRSWLRLLDENEPGAPWTVSQQQASFGTPGG